MVIAPLTAIGLGFLINDLILLPLVLVFLLMTLWGLHRGKVRTCFHWPPCSPCPIGSASRQKSCRKNRPPG